MSRIFHFRHCIWPGIVDEGYPQVIELRACIWIYCVVLGCFRFSRGLRQKETDETHKSCKGRGGGDHNDLRWGQYCSGEMVSYEFCDEMKFQNVVTDLPEEIIEEYLWWG